MSASPVWPEGPPSLERAEARASPTTAEARGLAFHGSGWTLLGIQIVNALLTLVTLGVYYFWGRARVRRYLVSQAEIEGDRFAYHGTGKELLLGWLKAALVFGIPLALLSAAPELLGAGWALQAALMVGVYAVLLIFIPVAMVGARRYRLSRTSWRGIRFSFRGRALAWIPLFVGGMLLSLVSFGLCYPFYDARRQRFMLSHSYFGNHPFAFDGDATGLFRVYLAVALTAAGGSVLAGGLGAAIAFAAVWIGSGETWPLGLLVAGATLALAWLVFLGVCWLWLSARRQRYLWAHTAFGEARFRSTITLPLLVRLWIGNLLLLLVTLGLAWPWVTLRTLRLVLHCLSLEGPVDFALVQQEAQAASTTGEGLAGFLDAGFDLG